LCRLQHLRPVFLLTNMLLVRDQRRRRTRFGALALLVTCVSIPTAARQSSPTDAAAKPATANSATTSQSAQKPSAPQSAGATKSASTAHAASAPHHSSRRKKSSRVRGQKKIDADRARTIQEALIREHYLTGEPTGAWNQASEDAMRRYQSDHGWQTKEVPDSRALISLGLGPSKDHLLNPESAMTTGPQKTSAATPASANPSSPASTPAPTSSSSQGDPSHPQ